jgi:hypothetical protein
MQIIDKILNVIEKIFSKLYGITWRIRIKRKIKNLKKIKKN